MKVGVAVFFLLVLTGACAAGNPHDKTDSYAISSGLNVMQVALSRNAPVIRGFRLNTGEEIAGKLGDIRPLVRFCVIDEGKNFDSNHRDAEVAYECKYTAGSVQYLGKLFWKEQPAAEFSLMFALSGNQLHVTSQLQRESKGFQLLSIELPPMVTVQSRKGAKLVIPTQSGRLINVEKADPNTHEIGATSADPVRLVMVYDNQALGMISMNSLDDKLYTALTSGIPKEAQLWVKFVFRPEASKPDYQFIAQQASTCTITIMGKIDKRPPTWMDAAKLLRQGTKSGPNPLYTSSFTYRIMCDVPGQEDITSFTDCLNLIEEINALTGSRQIVYLAGWQHSGHDTGYPDVFEVNKRLGGEEGLRDLIARAKGFDAIVSLHDNYDYAYEESPGWDARMIALDSQGELMKGEVRAGGQSYVLSPYKYAFGRGMERIKETINTYPIEKTIYIDALSSEASRCDFNPEHPAGAQKNLQGKLKIVEQFKKHGLDVASEGFTACFADKISFFSRLQHDTTKIFSDEEVIPLVPFIYHAQASAGDTLKTDEDILRALLYGLTASGEFTKDTSMDHILDLFYLVNLPWSKLAALEMTDYRKNGDEERVDYEDGSYVEINLKKNIYKVVAQGSVIGQNWTATVPLDKKTIAVYSRKGGDVSFTAPAAWDLQKIQAHKLKPDGTKERVELGAEERTLTIRTEPHVPYWVSGF